MQSLSRRTLLAAPALPAAGTVRAGASRPALVELFTSQGCSSCPPADALLSELAGHDDVLALSLHVDYWNRLGWRDPYSLAEATRRQRGYAAQLGLSYVYTPQAVIEGATHVVGSDRGQLLAALAAARRHNDVPLSLRRDGAEALVRVPVGASARPASIFALTFADAQAVRVTRGENAGRTLAHRNVVRSLRLLGDWHGNEATWRIAVATDHGLAVIAQHGLGQVRGLAVLRAAT